jgi:hypothetical protein
MRTVRVLAPVAFAAGVLLFWAVGAPPAASGQPPPAVGGGGSGSPYQPAPVLAPPANVFSYQGQNFWTLTGGAHSNVHKLVQDYLKAEREDDKREVRRKLADELGQQFDEHAKQQQRELEDLEKQITKLRETLRKRSDAKAKIVDRRIDQLIEDSEGMGWTAPGTPRQFHVPWMEGLRPATVRPVEKK